MFGDRSAGAGALPLPGRVLVAGVSGAGKSTLADTIAGITGAPRIEIDSLFHGPGWVPRPQFVAEVTALAGQDAWVIEWQYSAVRPLLVERAEMMVWLDLPTSVVMWRVIRRTIRRRIKHIELWNGNYEPPLHTFFTNPDHIVRWAWRTRNQCRDQIHDAVATTPHVTLVRLRSRHQVNRWVTRAVQARPRQ
jgi:adenylate kinase family enzyme